MRLSAIIAASCLAPLTLAAQETTSYVIRLGRDTLGLERVTRTAQKVSGEYVMRAPQPVHALYTADLNPNGTVRRFELITHNIAGGPGPAETRATVEFLGDSAVLTLPRGDSTVTQRVAAGSGAVIWLGYPVAMYEQLARQARAAGGAPYTVPALTTGQLRGTVTVTRAAGDTLSAGLKFSIGEVGPLRMTLDQGGRLSSLSAVGTPLQIVIERVPSVDIDGAGPDFAKRPLGTLSPRDTVVAGVGGAELSVEYSRPAKRGREIFGRVVPWNQVWRAGANAATHFTTSADLTIGGARVPAGTYTLWALPSPTGWKLIINQQTRQWGTDYHADQDLARVDMRVETLPQPVEQFTIAVESDRLVMSWDRTRAWVPITR
jgi:hypothetical protein